MWIKEWICNERQIAIYAIVKVDMPEVSDLASAWGPEGTRTNQGPCIIYIMEKPARPHAQKATFVLFAAARLTGWFHIRLFLFIWGDSDKPAASFTSSVNDSR